MVVHALNGITLEVEAVRSEFKDSLAYIPSY